MFSTRHLVLVTIPFVTTLALVASQSGCSAAAEPDRREADRVAASDRAIRGGTPATAYPEAVLVDMQRGGAVVAACSGVLVAPRAVLTAAHCVVGYDGFRVAAPYAGGQVATATRTVTYDYVATTDEIDPRRHDVGLIFLGAPISLDSYPAIAGAPVSPGTHVIHIGRVRRGYASATDLFASKPVAVAPAASIGFPYDYMAREAIEPGNSGGPEVLPGPAPRTVVSVSSGADAGVEVLARVDLLAGWLSDQIALHGGACAAAHDPCDVGGPIAAACSPCARAVCATDPFCCEHRWDAQCAEEAALGCPLPACDRAPEDDCDGVSYEGQCQGEVVVWCDGGLHTMDCAAEGLSCAWDAAQGFNSCL